MGISNQIPSSRLIQPGVITNASERPASPFEGQVIFQKDTDQLLVWSGTAWVCTSSLAGLQIDSSGRVTTPLRPAFRYHGWTMTANGMQGGTAPLNIGSCLTIGSGGTYSKFTAPVAGLYFIGASCLIETGAGRVEFIFTKNGSGSIDGYATYAINNFASSPNGYVDVAGSYIFYLAAGDYIGMTPPVFGTLYGDMTRGDRMFQGFLIG